MLFDKRYERPSDNPLRVSLYAVAAVLAVYTTVALAYEASNYGGAFSGGSTDRSSSSWSNGSTTFRDASTAFGGRGTTGDRAVTGSVSGTTGVGICGCH